MRPQTIQHWKDRGVPMSELFHIRERIGCPLDALLREGAIEELNLTAEERALVAYFRQADREAQEALFKLIPALRSLIPVPAPPPPKKK